ncbi:MAG: hypothetical protein ACI9UA_005910, partial [Pseudoalteromonas tetraodonis]
NPCGATRGMISGQRFAVLGIRHGFAPASG